MDQSLEDMEPLRALLAPTNPQQAVQGKNMSQLIALLEDISNEPFDEEEEETAEPLDLFMDPGVQYPPAASQEPQASSSAAQCPPEQEGNAEPPMAANNSTADAEQQTEDRPRKNRLIIDVQSKDDYTTCRGTHEGRRTKKKDTVVEFGPQTKKFTFSDLEEDWSHCTRTHTDRLATKHAPYLRAPINPQ
jgi:hypothetical protein